jgi:hypothetical protein
MKYKIGYGSGIEVFCDSIIFHDNILISASMVGRQGPLKAVIAALVDKKGVMFKQSSDYQHQLFRSNEKCSFKISHLGDNIYQGVFFKKEGIDQVTTKDDFSLAVNALHDLPFHDSWADFVFRLALKKNLVKKLTSYAELETENEYYVINFTKEELQQIIVDNFNHLKRLIN